MHTISSEQIKTGTTRPGTMRLKALRVLVVDDDKTNLLLIEHYLENLVLHVETASDGLTALQSFRRSWHDLVITDLQMPYMDGYTLATYVKRESANTVVFIMTGSGRFEVEDYMKAATVDAWFFKPFTPASLICTIRKYTNSTNCRV